MTTPTSIARIAARSILDSRGRPTVEVDVELRDGSSGRASVPSGASAGRHEAIELRDRDDSHYEGRGVSRAVGNVLGPISNRLVGADAASQSLVDDALVELDGTANFAKLGANASLGTSLAICRAVASSKRLPLYRYVAALAGCVQPLLPMPMVNILSGGAHAGRGMDVQDFLAVPVSATSYSEALEMVGRVRAAGQHLMQKSGLSTLLADEGGLSPRFKHADEAMRLMVQSIEEAQLEPGKDVAIAIDVAASELWHAHAYQLRGEGRRLDSRQMIEFVAEWVQRYPVISIEDALDQDDWDHWPSLTAKLAGIQVVGDDLFVTSPTRIAQGADRGAANAVLIKLNQNGTLSGTLRALAVAQSAGYAAVVSARSGETEDPFIADLAVGTGVGQIKVGSVRSSERLVKYNQLLRIEAEHVPFAGMRGYAPLNRNGVAPPVNSSVKVDEEKAKVGA
jgi:enolase